MFYKLVGIGEFLRKLKGIKRNKGVWGCGSSARELT
jgi:hypothetical protein